MAARDLVAVVGLLVLGLAAVTEAVNNCWFCDSNTGDCKNPGNWAVRTCAGAGGPDLPCYKVLTNGNRGCASLASCSVSAGVRNYDFEWSAPLTWIWWNLVSPAGHDCWSVQGCHNYFCCRDQDRCNSSPGLNAFSPAVVSLASLAVASVVYLIR